MGYIENITRCVNRNDNAKDKGVSTITIKENGNKQVLGFDFADVKVEGAGPVTTPVKGDYILIDGRKYLVLQANEDGSDVEVMLMDLAASYWYSDYPTSDQKVTFMVDGVETQGVKYENSDLDKFCNETFFNMLPEDVQSAIIEQEIVQDMYDTATEGTEDLLITGGTFGSTCRIKKVNDESILIGNRKVYALSAADLIKYLGSTTTNNLVNKFYFGYDNTISPDGWLRDAYRDAYSPSDSNGACYVYGADGYVSDNICNSNCIVRPAFHINLKSINYSK